MAESYFDFKAAMDLRQGLVNTVKWFDESNILNSY